MSDNTTLPPGGGGDTIRTMDRATSKTQVVGLDFGPDAGPENLVSTSNGLPVSQILGSSWSVTGTGTFSVSGTVAVSSVGGSVSVGNFPAVQQVAITNLQLSGNGNLLVDASIVGVDLGPGLMETSLPVTLAQDQDIPMRPTGLQPGAQSVSVVLATDQATLPINFPPTILPPNAAQETGGNLALSANALVYLAQIADTLRFMLSELRASNLQLASMTGVTIDPAIGDEQITYQ